MFSALAGIKVRKLQTDIYDLGLTLLRKSELLNSFGRRATLLENSSHHDECQLYFTSHPRDLGRGSFFGNDPQRWPNEFLLRSNHLSFVTHNST